MDALHGELAGEISYIYLHGHPFSLVLLDPLIDYFFSLEVRIDGD